MNAEQYHVLSPFEKELYDMLIRLQKDVDYLKDVAKRLEKELPEEDDAK